MQETKKSDVKDRMFSGVQYLLPQHGLSRLMGWIGDSHIRGIKNALIRWWIKHYDVPMHEALYSDPEHYASFNDFFTRAMREEVRPFPEDESLIVSPADGAISQQGDIVSGRIFQAKGFDFSVEELLGGDNALADEFAGGYFSTIYLSPRDYHRVHMPCKGTLREMIHIPGQLFSVNTVTCERVPRLFARNERLVCLFDTEIGPMAMVLVGAMIVASIETVWAGEITPERRKIKRTDYKPEAQTPITLNRGDEMGRFKLGSTVVMLFGKDSLRWNEHLNAEDSVLLGQSLARRHP